MIGNKPGRVIRSINNPTADHCVDLFVREDGSFGYQQYRRDFEDGGGWFPVGYTMESRFSDEASALSEAEQTVSWFRNG